MSRGGANREGINGNGRNEEGEHGGSPENAQRFLIPFAGTVARVIEQGVRGFGSHLPVPGALKEEVAHPEAARTRPGTALIFSNGELYGSTDEHQKMLSPGG